MDITIPGTRYTLGALFETHPVYDKDACALIIKRGKKGQPVLIEAAPHPRIEYCPENIDTIHQCNGKNFQKIVAKLRYDKVLIPCDSRKYKTSCDISVVPGWDSMLAYGTEKFKDVSCKVLLSIHDKEKEALETISSDKRDLSEGPVSFIRFYEKVRERLVEKAISLFRLSHGVDKVLEAHKDKKLAEVEDLLQKKNYKIQAGLEFEARAIFANIHLFDEMMENLVRGNTNVSFGGDHIYNILVEMLVVSQTQRAFVRHVNQFSNTALYEPWIVKRYTFARLKSTLEHLDKVGVKLYFKKAPACKVAKIVRECTIHEVNPDDEIKTDANYPEMLTIIKEEDIASQKETEIYYKDIRKIEVFDNYTESTIPNKVVVIEVLGLAVGLFLGKWMEKRGY